MPARKVPAVKVLVVDDHRSFGDAVGIAVGQDEQVQVTIVTSGDEAIRAASMEPPDIILMDVEMPGIDGISATRRVLEIHPETRVIVLSSHDDDVVKARALEAGAAGFVSKLEPVSEVARAVRAAARGEPLIDLAERERLSSRLHHRRQQASTERQRANRLTARQIQILQLLADGLSVQDIAEKLDMSPLTVRTHVQNILTRLGVHTKLEAVALAIRHGKIELGR